MVVGQNTKKTDAEIKKLIITESIADYSGSCPLSIQHRQGGKELWRSERIQ
jgi:hypothetical protein